MRNPFFRRPALLLALLSSAALAACGGGGDSASATQPAPDAPALAGPTQDAPPALEASCANCAALDADSYAGQGTGIWHRSNTGSLPIDVPVQISGLSGQDVTLVVTNEAATEATMPPINMSWTPQPLLKSQLPATPAEDPHARIRAFNREGWAERIAQAAAAAPLAGALKSGVPQAAMAEVGASRRFHHEDGSRRTASLHRQARTADGTVVNLWLEEGEAGPAKVTPGMLDQLTSSYARAGGIHDMLLAVGGPLWGPHAHAELIAGAGQPIDIVVLNFDRNQRPFGMVGYFWALHALRKEVDIRSNEAVSMYLDSETLYLGGDSGPKVAQMTLAHEGMHMSNFYRRGVSMGVAYQFETWLEEMTAMMMEDAAAAAIDPSYSPIRDVRLRDYLARGHYNCALKDWTPLSATCDSYAISGSFGGFLLRQLGVGFFKDLLTQRQAGSQEVLEAALQAARPGTGLGPHLRQFAASAIALLPGAAPAGFGFPARSEAGFAIPGIDASRYTGSRSLPASAPATVAAYGNFPVLRRDVQGTFSEVVRVPPGTTLSVVVQ